MPKPQLQMEVQKAQEESPSDDVDINSAAVTILCIQRTLHHSPSKGVTVMVLLTNDDSWQQIELPRH